MLLRGLGHHRHACNHARNHARTSASTDQDSNPTQSHWCPSHAQGGKTALMLAVEHKAEGVAKLLIQAGADGWTALMSAIQYEEYGVAKQLIKDGAELDARNKARPSAMQICATAAGCLCCVHRAHLRTTAAAPPHAIFTHLHCLNWMRRTERRR